MAAYAPYILMAVGTAAEMAGERNAAKERRGILNRSLESTEKERDKSAEKLLAEGSQYGAQRQQALDAQEQSAMARALQDVAGSMEPNGAGAQIINTAGDAGNISQDFIKAKADKALGEGSRLTAVARELAKVRAPGQLMNSEGIRRSGMAGEIGSAASTARNMAGAAGLDAQNVDSPWWGKLGTVAKMAGSVWAGGAGLGGSAAGTGASAVNGSAMNTAVAPRIAFG